jgi:hypothetical protein
MEVHSGRADKLPVARTRAARLIVDRVLQCGELLLGGVDTELYGTDLDRPTDQVEVAHLSRAEARNDGAAVELLLDEPFGDEQADTFTEGVARDVEFSGERRLAQRRSGADVPTSQPLAEGVRHLLSGGDGLDLGHGEKVTHDCLTMLARNGDVMSEN